MDILRRNDAMRRILVACVVLLIILVFFLAGMLMRDCSRPTQHEQEPRKTTPVRPKNQDPLSPSYRTASLDTGQEAGETPAS